MFGNSAFAQYAFCGRTLPKIIPPPPPPVVSNNDGFKRGERKKLAEATAKLEKAQQLRTKAKISDRESLRYELTRQIAPELLPKEEPKKEAKRKTLTIKSREDFDLDIADYEAQINAINRARWFRIAREYEERLEAARLAELDDEETLLLLL